MRKRYKKIEFYVGRCIESAIEELKRHDGLVFGTFNGQKLYSDIDDLDSAYKKITGKTKAEFDAIQKTRHDVYEEEQRKHRESIPRLTKEWIDKGKVVLDEEYLELWSQCVPARLDDLYQGMELGACLEIVKELNAGCSLNVAKVIIEKQSHSGMSFGLVCAMVKSFCKRGTDFKRFVR